MCCRHPASTRRVLAAASRLRCPLAGKEWVLGSHYSVADPYTLVIFGWGKRHGMPLEELKNYTAFKDRMLRRPAVRKVLEREQSRLLQG
jgi:glutathione S-transferase